jgi:hypothetical protein
MRFGRDLFNGVDPIEDRSDLGQQLSEVDDPDAGQLPQQTAHVGARPSERRSACSVSAMTGCSDRSSCTCARIMACTLAAAGALLSAYFAWRTSPSAPRAADDDRHRPTVDARGAVERHFLEDQPLAGVVFRSLRMPLRRVSVAQLVATCRIWATSGRSEPPP